MDFDLDLAIAVLRRSPATLRALLDGLSDSWIRANEGPETFSPFDVVGHLSDGDGEAIPRPGRAVDPVSAGAHRPSRTALMIPPADYSPGVSPCPSLSRTRTRRVSTSSFLISPLSTSSR